MIARRAPRLSVGLFTYSTQPRGSVVHAAALADALAELVDDIPFRLALGRHALAHAQRRSWSASYDELLAGYGAVVRRPPVPHRIAA